MQAIFDGERYNGLTLSEWLPQIVDRLVQQFEPVKVILSGSLARGTHNRDSDIDLLVVLPHLEHKRRAAVDMGVAVADFPVPINIIPTDQLIEKRKLEPGSLVRAALREGECCMSDQGAKPSNEHVIKWIQFARSDLYAAQQLLNQSEIMPFVSGFQAQQAVVSVYL